MRSRTLALTAFVVAVCVSVAPAAGVPGQAPRSGGTVVLLRGTNTEPACLNPFACAAGFDPSTQQVLEGAFEVGPDLVAQLKKGGRRASFPEHLPQVNTRYELPEEQRVCFCGEKLHEIGVETSRELDRIEVSVVHTIERAKYACRDCPGTVSLR